MRKVIYGEVPRWDAVEKPSKDKGWKHIDQLHSPLEMIDTASKVVIAS